MISGAAQAGSEDLRFSGACASGTKVTVSAVGDILMHSSLQRQAERSRNGFKTNWMEAIPYLQISDVSYGNLEGPVAPGVSCRGTEHPNKMNASFGGDCRKNSKGIYTGYPKFNYHRSLIDDLQDSGIDIVSAANNHSLDRKSIGVDKTVESLMDMDLPFTGIRDTRGEKKDWHTVTWAKGKSIAWLSCTAVMNSKKDPHRQILRCYNSSIAQKVSQLSKSHDAVIVTPHWGSEYTGKPSGNQKKYAKAWLDAGAIAVLGAHPHVVQPWEKYTAKDGRETLIIYSLGNFVSNQATSGKPSAFSPKQASAIVYFGITFSRRGSWINGVRYVPTYMRNRRTDHKKLLVDGLSRSSKEDATLKFLSKYFGTERRSRSLNDLKTNMECR